MMSADELDAVESSSPSPSLERRCEARDSERGDRAGSDASCDVAASDEALDGAESTTSTSEGGAGVGGSDAADRGTTSAVGRR